jgi:hypothetical protein
MFVVFPVIRNLVRITQKSTASPQETVGGYYTLSATGVKLRTGGGPAGATA